MEGIVKVAVQWSDTFLQEGNELKNRHISRHISVRRPSHITALIDQQRQQSKHITHIISLASIARRREL